VAELDDNMHDENMHRTPQVWRRDRTYLVVYADA
jgi:hypothetical protein